MAEVQRTDSAALAEIRTWSAGFVVLGGRVAMRTGWKVIGLLGR